jgi:hypothetical protein
VLWSDVIASGATGLLMIAAAGVLESFLGLPSTFTREAGLILVPYVAFVAFVAISAEISRAAVWVIIAANAVWTIGSFGLLVSGVVAPTAPGYAFVIAQALVVAILAMLQYSGLRTPTAVQAG